MWKRPHRAAKQPVFYQLDTLQPTADESQGCPPACLSMHVCVCKGVYLPSLQLKWVNLHMYTYLRMFTCDPRGSVCTYTCSCGYIYHPFDLSQCLTWRGRRYQSLRLTASDLQPSNRTLHSLHSPSLTCTTASLPFLRSLSEHLCIIINFTCVG